MVSVESISAAIESVAAKRENLRQAFENVQSHPAAISSFAMSWEALDDYFNSIEKSIHQSFEDLKSKEQKRQQSTIGSLPSRKEESQEKGQAKDDEKSEHDRFPDLKAYCSNMDAKGLWTFILVKSKDLVKLSDEITVVLQSAPDPAELVLDVMEKYGIPFSNFFWLERLRMISPVIKSHVKERAFKAAVQLKTKVSEGGKKLFRKALAFLNLVTIYGLASAFDVDELLDVVTCVGDRKQSVDACRDLGLSEKVPDLIQRLKNRGMPLDAIKFVCSFKLLDKFPPASLFEEFLQDFGKHSQEIREKENNSIESQNLAIDKEIGAIRMAIGTLEEYKLESEYPREQLQKRIVDLKKQKAHQQPAAINEDEDRKVKYNTENTSKPQHQPSIEQDSGGNDGSNRETARNPKQLHITNQNSVASFAAKTEVHKPQQLPGTEQKANDMHTAVEVPEPEKQPVTKQKKHRGKRAGKRHAANTGASKPPEQLANKRPQPTASTSVVSTASIPTRIQTNPPAMQPSHLLVGGLPPYLGSAGSYGMVGPNNSPSMLGATGKWSPVRPPFYSQQLLQPNLYSNPSLMVHQIPGHSQQPYHPSSYP